MCPLDAAHQVASKSATPVGAKVQCNREWDSGSLSARNSDFPWDWYGGGHDDAAFGQYEFFAGN